MLASLDYKPAPWQPVDCLVFSKYMGWDQLGTNDDLWFGAMVEKLGVTAAEELWPLERPYEVATVQSQSKWPAKKTARAELVPLPKAASAYAAAFGTLSLAQWYGRGAQLRQQQLGGRRQQVRLGQADLVQRSAPGIPSTVDLVCRACLGQGRKHRRRDVSRLAGVRAWTERPYRLGRDEHAERRGRLLCRDGRRKTRRVTGTAANGNRCSGSPRRFPCAE